jgi:hypothetical protein
MVPEPVGLWLESYGVWEEERAERMEADDRVGSLFMRRGRKRKRCFMTFVYLELGRFQN